MRKYQNNESINMRTDACSFHHTNERERKKNMTRRAQEKNVYQYFIISIVTITMIYTW